MSLAAFILEELQPLLANWDANARAAPTDQYLDRAALRDHAEQILREIASDMCSEQSPHEQRAKSEGNAPAGSADATPAQIHGAGRFEQGFAMEHMVGEYRALRATVMRQWGRALPVDPSPGMEEIIRFNEALDQAIAESVEQFTREHQQAIKAQQQSAASYRTLFDWAPYGIVVADRAGTYLDANAALAHMTGYSVEELKSLHAHDLIATSDATVADFGGDFIACTADDHHAFQLRRKDGSTVFVEVLGASLPDGNSLGFVRDVTERKQDEDQIRLLNETLERRVLERTTELAASNQRLKAANEQLESFSTAVAHDLRVAEAADRMKSMFLATMSHELRTPLNSIIGFTDIVLEGMAGPVNSEQVKQLGMARASARHLLSLINDVLDLSKLEAGKLEARGEAVDVRASVERLIESMQPAARAKQLSLRFRVAPELREIVTDRRRVEQILLNLIGNALKFTERGGVTLTVEPTTDVRSSTRMLPGPMIRFTVTDTGIGIRPEDMRHLFKPFRQLDASHTRREDGTGLGLVICQRLAALLGGEVTVESQWTHGSTFALTIPLDHAGEAGSPRCEPCT